MTLRFTDYTEDWLYLVCAVRRSRLRPVPALKTLTWRRETNIAKTVLLAGGHASSARLESKPVITVSTRNRSPPAPAHITAAIALIRTKLGPPVTHATLLAWLTRGSYRQRTEIGPAAAGRQQWRRHYSGWIRWMITTDDHISQRDRRHRRAGVMHALMQYNATRLPASTSQSTPAL